MTPSGAAYTYDRNGNLLTRTIGGSRWSYAWDVPGDLLKVSNGTVVQGYYAYDGTGRRVESKEGTATVFFAYGGTETLCERVSGGAETNCIYPAGYRLAIVTGSTTSYFHTDALGSTQLVTNFKGKALFSDNYQPYGQDNGTPTGSETYKFTSKPYSSATGLYYDYQRWYDPSIGRFISPDPLPGYLSDPQSLNPYIYVLDRPTSLTDPSGLDACGWNPLSWGGCVNNVVQSASNWWNSQDQSTKLAIIAVVATVAIVATAGLAAPALVPLIATGIAIGAGTSTASYVASSIVSGNSISLKGLLTSAAIGGFFGAVSFGTYGAVAGAASAAGLGGLGSFAAGLAASTAVSTGLSRLLGTDSSNGNEQSLQAYVSNTASQEAAGFQGPSYKDNLPCRAGVTAIIAAPFIFSIGSVVSWAGEEGPIHKVGLGIEISAVGVLAIGVGLAASSC